MVSFQRSEGTGPAKMKDRSRERKTTEEDERKRKPAFLS